MEHRSSPSVDGAVNLLALDGGGIRGVSELLILHEIMHRVRHDLNLAQFPRPCDYFHLIGGTSTGGLIALMLGRLRMTTEEALKKYNSLAGEIFSKDNRKWAVQDGTFKATTLENKLKELVAERALGEFMFDASDDSNMGNAFVCAMPAKDLTHPRRFRTYHVRTLASANCKIWEAARATTAAPTFFKRIVIGEEGRAKEEFIDGGVRCNNPANQVLEEARNIFGDNRTVGCLISIGTGHPGTIGLAKPDSFQKILPLKLISVLKGIATDCERTSHALSLRFRDFPNFYFRFNVSHGAEGISLEEWEKMGDIESHTKAYMEDVGVSASIDAVVKILCKSVRTGFTLGNICGVPINPAVNPPMRIHIRPEPIPSPIFTGRKEILQRLEAFFGARQHGSSPRREYLLCGMGGAGKTQVALKFVDEHLDRFDRVFWIDASSKVTIEQSYKDIAAERITDAAGSARPVESVLQWLSKSNEEWLLFFDNADTLQDLSDFLPGGNRGNILYTSRNPALRLSLPRSAFSEVNEMPESEAVTLLMRAACLEETSQELRKSAEPIVKELGHLALAIDQAGAYVAMGCCHIEDYVQTFRNHQEELLKNPIYKGASKYNQAVYATWDISYTAIENSVQAAEGNAKESQDAKNALQILNLFAFFHNEGIMEEIFKRAAENAERRDGSEDGVNILHQLLCLDKDGVWDPFPFRAGISILLSFSLVKQDQSGRYLSIHVLVHSWVQHRLYGSARQCQSRSAKTLLSRSVTWRFLTEDYNFRRKLLPHIRACQKNGLATEITELERSEQTSNYALVFHEAGQWTEAEELLVQVAETRKRVLGQEHPSTLTSMANLASTYRNQGRWKEAEELEVQVMETSLRVLGQEHPSTLTSMGNLASTYRNQGRWKEAEELEVQVMETRKRVLGQEHPDTLTSIHNLAFTRKSLGRDNEALILMKECFRLRKQKLGSDHTRTVSSLDALNRWETASLVLDS